MIVVLFDNGVKSLNCPKSFQFVRKTKFNHLNNILTISITCGFKLPFNI